MTDGGRHVDVDLELTSPKSTNDETSLLNRDSTSFRQRRVITGVGIVFLVMLTITVMFLVAEFAVPSTDESSSNDLDDDYAVDALMDETYEIYLEDSPELATFVGDPRYNNRLSDESLAAYEARARVLGGLYGEWEAIDREDVAEEKQLQYDALGWVLRMDVERLQYENYLMPVSQLDGIHIDFLQVVGYTNFEVASDFTDYVERLSSLPLQIEQTQILLEIGLEKGISRPSPTLQGVPDQITPLYTLAGIESSFYAPLAEADAAGTPQGFSETEWENTKTEALRVIDEEVRPAWQTFYDYVAGVYMPNATDDIAATSLPNGQAYYDWCVRYHTTQSTLDADAIHEIGTQEVDRIFAEMNDVFESTEQSQNMTYEEFVDFLRTDPQFYAETEEDYLDFVRSVAKRADAQLPTLFSHFPRCPYGVEPIPEAEAPTAPAAYYMPPDFQCSRPGIFYLNTYDLESRPKYLMQSTTLHETVPGHHFQLALQGETETYDILKLQDFTAYVEGWALYSESLGYEMGFYEDPYYQFGRLGDEMLRACRLVVDTGMHKLGWSRQDAIDYMVTYTPLSLLDITSEVDRYIAWPGQALSYKIGELFIHDLKDTQIQNSNDAGTMFDVRGFHDTFLATGALPLELL